MQRKWTKTERHDMVVVEQEGGKRLTLAPSSSRGLIERDGYAFKDFLGTGELVPYEDWRLSPDERARDLAERLSIEDIAGLMLYSSHQTLTKNGHKYAPLFGANTYGGESFDPSRHNIWDLTDQQRAFLTNDHVRHILLSSVDSAEVAARWNNEVQALCEREPFGIPANISSDPRHGISADAEYNLGAGSDISHWPEELGLAASFDPQLVRTFAEVASREYRALGIATALSPQIDLATEPRWSRFAGTFGSCPEMTRDMARAYCDGMQSDEDAGGSWGKTSVNAMVKHWPGGGTGEGGRDAHYCFGKYAVYPGGRFGDHQMPFVDGAFRLEGGTDCAAAVMPYYTISFGQDQANGEEVGNGFSSYIVGELLRKRCGFDGVVCTDWAVTRDMGKTVGTFAGKCWGVEGLSVAERHYKALLAGVDQFGGNNDKVPVLEAYRMGCAEFGEEYMERRFRESARRLLRNIFQVGLFEDPYLDVQESSRIVGCSTYTRLGYEAQRKSVVMLKNRNCVLPMRRGAKVYIPPRSSKEKRDWFGNVIPAHIVPALAPGIVERYYEQVDDPVKADFAIVCVTSPISKGYSDDDRADGGNGYLPISLQYRPYQAEAAREHSIASGDPLEPAGDRSYRGKTTRVENEGDLDMILETRRLMGNKPVVVASFDKRPAIVAEYENEVDAILVHFGVSDQALLSLIAGEVEPSGLLPFQIPASMETVERHSEDVPGDIECYVDELGHSYDFGFGLGWSGPIDDERTHRYRLSK